MAIIDVGSEAISRPSFLSGGYTLINLNNPANEDGIIDTVELWASSTDMTGVKVATFSLTSGTTYKAESVVTIGTVDAGAKRTFTGLNLSIKNGHYIGVYFVSGAIYRTNTGGNGAAFVLGDKTGTSESYDTTSFAASIISLYGTGATTGNPGAFFQMF